MADDTTHLVPAVPDEVISEAHDAFLHAFSSAGSRNAVAAALRTATPMLYRAWLDGCAVDDVDVDVDVDAHHLAELRGVQDRYLRLLTTSGIAATLWIVHASTTLSLDASAANTEVSARS